MTDNRIQRALEYLRDVESVVDHTKGEVAYQPFKDFVRQLREILTAEPEPTP